MNEAEQIVRALAKQCDGYWVWNERVLREAGLVEVLERLSHGQEACKEYAWLHERTLGGKR